jgi:tRNA pseudouridine38-40 synthase
VRVYRVGWAPEAFHARYASSGKEYRYHLFLGPVVPPALFPFLWQWQGELDLDAMDKASRQFVGEHDYSAFTTADGREKNTIRRIDRCQWERRGSLLVLHVTGHSFLHRMVRCMAGALVGVGTGRLSSEVVANALEGSMEGPQIPALPAQGLVLWEVHYPPEVDVKQSFGTFPDGPFFPL